MLWAILTRNRKCNFYTEMAFVLLLARSAKLYSCSAPDLFETCLERSGSRHWFGCTKNQLRRPFLRPVRETIHFSAPDLSETILERSGSPRCFGCSKNQLCRPILRPVRDGFLISMVWTSRHAVLLTKVPHFCSALAASKGKAWKQYTMSVQANFAWLRKLPSPKNWKNALGNFYTSFKNAFFPSKIQ